jgi:iron(III) transport system substrate-binding protein
MTKARYRTLLTILISALFVAACNRIPQKSAGAGEVTIYVSTDRVFSEPILRGYEQKTGVKVNVVYDTEETKSTGLANRLLAEKGNPQADVFWSNEPVRTLVLKSRGVLSPYKSPGAADIPSEFKDAEGYWTGFSARLRVIVYNTNLVKAEDAPARRSSWRPVRSWATAWLECG